MSDNQGNKEVVEVLSKSDFYFNTPLYEVMKSSEIESNLFSGIVEGYNHYKECDTTFNISSDRVSSHGDLKDYRVVTLTCKRHSSEFHYFIYDVEISPGKRIIVKIGQLPSLADISEKEVDKKYTKNIESKYLRPFKKAIGLAAHGIGAGSFVYLRKIFEDLIWETFKKHAGEHGVQENDFKVLRMIEKVDKLKSFLPEQIVKMKSLYGIMSEGVHTLPEEECLKYFPAIKLAIEVIWDEQIDQKSKESRTVEIEKEIKQIEHALKRRDEK